MCTLLQEYAILLWEKNPFFQGRKSTFRMQVLPHFCALTSSEEVLGTRATPTIFSICFCLCLSKNKKFCFCQQHFSFTYPFGFVSILAINLILDSIFSVLPK